MGLNKWTEERNIEGSEGQRDGLEGKGKGKRGKSDGKRKHMRKGGKDREMD